MRSLLFLTGVLTLALSAPAANDPLKSLQWGLLNQGQSINEALTDLEFEKVTGIAGYDIGRRKTPLVKTKLHRDVIVAVIDSGLDITHPELQGRIFTNSAECDSLGRPPFMTDLDKDGNGYAGDCMGWNVSGQGNINRVNDDVGHGTHVAGIIAALEDNNVGIAGVASQVKILPIKLTYRGDQGQGYTTRMLKALQYALDMNADIINLSLGWPAAADTASLQAKVKEALARGILIVVAAGNNTTEKPIYPCSYEGVICVGSVRPDGQLSQFSNYGAHVDVLAPGSHILSLIPMGMTPGQFSVGGYDFKSGTSQATPFVAGSLAILKSLLPEASNDELKARLFLTANSRPSNVSSINGLIQTDNAFEVEVQSAVYPVSKGDSTIVLNNNGTFELPLVLKNYWQTSGLVKLNIQSSDNVTLQQQEFQISSIASGQTETLLLQGQIKDSSKNHVVRITLKIIEGEKIQTYSIAKTLIQVVTPVASKLSGLDFDLSGFPMDQGLTKLRPLTVKNNFKKDDETEYYFPGSYGDSYFITLMRRQGERLTPTALPLKKGETILNFVKMDLNGDGKADYLVQSYNSLEASNSFKLWYLNSDLKPLFDTLYFSYDVSFTMPNWRDMGWIAMRYKGQRMLVPVFSFKGTVVPADQHKDPFETTDEQTVTNRLYYYRPNSEKKSLELRSFDTFNTMKSLRSMAGIGFPEKFLFKLIFPQSVEEISQGNSRVLIEVVGGRSGARYYHLQIGEGASVKKLSRISGTFNLQGFQLVRQPGLDANADSFFMSRTQSSGIIEFAWLRGTQTPQFYSYVHNKKGDNIIGPLTASAETGGIRLLVETKSQVMSMFIDKSGRKTVSSSPINRSSVLSNSVFTELFAPIRIDGKVALYIDASQLYRGHVYAISTTAGGFVPSISNSLQIGDGCNALNPSVQGSDSSFVVYCEDLSTRKKSIFKIPMQ